MSRVGRTPPGRTIQQVAALAHPGVVHSIPSNTSIDEPVTAVEIFASDSEVTKGSIQLVPGVRDGPGQSSVHEMVKANGATGVVLESVEQGHNHGAISWPDHESEPVVWHRTPGTSWMSVLDHLRSIVFDTEVEAATELPGIALGDMQRVADGLADLLGGPVIIEDRQLEVISYSSYRGQVDPGRDAAILGRRMPYEWMNYLKSTGDLDALLSQDAVVVDVPNGPLGARRRLLTSVRPEDELMGILWVAEGETRLPDDIEELMERAAQILLPHLREYHLDQLSRTRERNRNLRSLFDGVAISGELLRDLGLSPAGAHVLVAARRADGEPFGSRERTRVLDIMTLYFQAYRWGATPIILGGTAYCLITASERLSDHVVLGAMKGLVKTCVKSLGAELHITISEAMADLDDLSRVRSDAERLLASLGRQAHQVGRILTANQGAITLALDRAADAALDSGPTPYGKVALLEAHDTKHASNLVESLATFLTLRGNTSAAAERLHLHKTSLAYRLNRIAEISGISLDDPNEYLLCLLLLRDRAK